MRDLSDTTVLVTGATGYIGGRLIPELLRFGCNIYVMTRDKKHLQGRSWLDQVQVVEADVLNPRTLREAVEHADVAYYLIHSMMGGSDFHARDIQAAHNFARAAEDHDLKQIIYVGGLGDEDDDLSVHLRSRQKVGDVLREYSVPVTEFRAAAIIGSGSASFEMLRYLTERIPVMLAPQWVYTQTQPVSIREVLAYLTITINNPDTFGEIFEIGGADIMPYKDMMLQYAEARGLRRFLLRVPYFTPFLSASWVHLMTPVPYSLAHPLIEGLRNEVVVRDGSNTRRVFPDVEPVPYRVAVQRALDALQADRVETTWTDSMAATWEEEEPYTFVEKQGMMIERRKRIVDAPADAVYNAFTALGGDNGWLYLNWLWHLRGRIDRWVGGPGYRRGRRSPYDLRVGDVLDFWRVEVLEPGKMMRLRAEMKTGGRAWLEYAVQETEDGRSKLLQTAYFAPEGLFGLLYWYALWVPHLFIFDGMIDKVVAEAREEDTSIFSYSDVRFMAGVVTVFTTILLALMWIFNRKD